jgi:hypothetical protein
MEAMAHKLLYDSALSEDPTLVTHRLPSVKAPTLVIDSAGSSGGSAGRRGPFPTGSRTGGA